VARIPEHVTGTITAASAADRGSSLTRDLARYYDLDLEDDPGDVEFYRALARRAGGAVLELGVGTGRVAVPLACDGWDVTGVDLDAHMLERAAQRWASGDCANRGSLELVHADLLDLDLGARFAFAFIALNTLLLIGTSERQAEAVAALARHLRPTGVAAVDVWVPRGEDLALYDGRLLLEWTRDDAGRRERVTKLTSARFEPAEGIVELETFFDAWSPEDGALRRTARSDRLKLVRAEDLTRFAEGAGLTVETLAGDYDLSSFGPGSERAVLVAGLV
jgi:SAM-dependent methyltransferase